MAVGGKYNGTHSDQALQRLLASLEQVCHKAHSGDDDRAFLAALLQNKALQALVHIHTKIVSFSNRGIAPSSCDASLTAEKVLHALQKNVEPEAKELCILISSPHVKTPLHHQITPKATEQMSR
uniref:Calcium/calmodulin dependent serine protein kinase/membrane associated guanylate kinase n=1 Tax=Rhipicephalus appendiculatus TaxID=34631 RepID=A0A131Z1L1_RHIAP